MKDWKNKRVLWSSVLLGLFAVAVFYTYKRLAHMKKHRATAVGKTVRCEWTLKGRWQAHFVFQYNGKTCGGYTRFNKKQGEDICYDHEFLVEFDSTDPRQNRMLFDSANVDR